MRTESRIQIIAVLTLLLSIVGAGILVPSVAAEAGRAQLNYTDRAEEGDPPEIALGIALGAFRGLFVNVLWFRAEQMKRDGKFHEAIQLSRTITKLQPRFPRVWSFLAWNMAYNISVATHTASERWQWVKAGIELLRDEAIPRNPNDPLLHKELAWIFFHKIQGVADDANQHYKRELAREWTIVLGPPPPDADTAEGRLQQRITILKGIASAPDTPAELEARQSLVRELVNRLKNEANLDLDFEFLRLFTMRIMFDYSGLSDIGMELSESNRNRALEQLLSEDKYEPVWRELVPYVRKRVLVDTYHMEPDRMVRYTKLYGPLDWRHPCSHAVYWATRGLEEAMRRQNLEDFDLTNTDRTIMGALQDLYRWGTINYDIINDSYVQMLNLDYVDVYGKVFEEIVTPRQNRRGEITSKHGVEREDRPFRVMGMGYVNFMRDVVRIYYRMGQRELANEYFERLRTWQGINYTEDPIELGMPLDEFIKIDFQERITSPQFASTEIVAALRDAFLRGLLRGDRNVFQAQRQYAYDVHTHYHERQNRMTLADSQANRMSFIPPIYLDAEADVLLQVILQLTSGSQLELPVQASLVYRRSPLRTAQAVYDELAKQLQNRVPDFARWFPEPPGMAEYRELRRQMEAGSDAAKKQLLNIEAQ